MSAEVGGSQAPPHDIIGIVRDFVGELRGRRMRAIDVTLRSRLDRDLGIDSLGRTELILRIERALHVRLPPAALAQAETVGDLIAAVETSAPHRRAETVAAPPQPLPVVPAPLDATTLTEVLDWHVARHPDRLHLTLVEDESTILGTMTYAQLAQAARGVAAGLVARNVLPGDRVALMLPTALDFFAAFFGVLYAGGIPVAIYPPARLSQLEEHMRRQAGILRNAGANVLITVPEALGLGSLLRGQVETLRLVESVATIAAEPQGAALPPAVDGAATAFIQYTSGSTGDPKGVVLSHANLLANIRALGAAIEASSADIFVSWLPLYHDFGLIGAWLGSLYFAAALYVMSPLSFLVRPETWLWAAHRFRATLSAAPNFAFELCVNEIEDANIRGLDLGSLRMVANGAEPVSAQTLQRFTARFARYGFKPEAMCPAYGLAESTLGLAFPPPGRPPLIDRVDREALTRRGVAAPAKVGDRSALEIVSSGQPLPGHEIRIVDDLGREQGDRREGRLEFRGPSATAGYFGNEAKTRELIRDGWRDSGDQAYLAGGEVFVTGRIKDMIIRAGRHIYPQEIEQAVGEISGVVQNGVAAFGTVDATSGTERTVILVETASADPTLRKSIQDRVREVTTDILGAPPDEVVLVRPQTVPKTASGKVRRSAAQDLYASGEIAAVQRTIRRQLARLFVASLEGRLARLPRTVGALIYAAWWWIVIALAAAIAWPAVMLLPRLAWRWAVVRGVSRAALACLGVPLTRTGVAVPSGNAVVVFNHASYADALAVAAVLPDAPAFLAKREFTRQFFAGAFLRRLGALFVERFDVAGSVADADAAAAVARAGRLIVVFPEGTFSRRPGLTDFYLGAFKIAVDAGLPVVPGAIQGTRSMLRSDQWFPRWSPISVHLDAAIPSTGSDFAAVLRLRDDVRSVVLRHCGEPDLGGLAKPPPVATG
ncbi:MAG TPA: AMP-binding protein [Xanthobacteraceae bacterium]|nr:AMP-binding protein [Xanthobacteraceae bacterium]